MKSKWRPDLKVVYTGIVTEILNERPPNISEAKFCPIVVSLYQSDMTPTNFTVYCKAADPRQFKIATDVQVLITKLVPSKKSEGSFYGFGVAKTGEVE